MAEAVQNTPLTFVLYLWSVFMLFSCMSGETLGWRQVANETANEADLAGTILDVASSIVRSSADVYCVIFPVNSHFISVVYHY